MIWPSGGGSLYVTATDPAGPWSEPVWLDQEGNDPLLLFDDDGTVYHTRHVGMCDGYIGQSTLDIRTGKLNGPLKEILRGTGGFTSWAARHSWHQSPGPPKVGQSLATAARSS
jgi:beta-xylosidase